VVRPWRESPPARGRCARQSQRTSARDSLRHRATLPFPDQHCRWQRRDSCALARLSRTPACVLRPCRRAGGRGSLLERVSVGLIRRERTEVVPTAVGEEPCQERRPVESFQPVVIRLELPRRRRELRSHRVTRVEWTVPTGRLDHGQRDQHIRWWTTIAAGGSAGADVMAFSSQRRTGLCRHSAETCNRRVMWVCSDLAGCRSRDRCLARGGERCEFEDAC
jgi:hypothetical protein